MHAGSGQSFFIPTVDDHGGERTYEQLRLQTEAQMGRAPNRRRITEIFTRRGSQDCITAVGSPDPISGGIVTAIFDMGSHQPFVVYCQDPADACGQSCDVLANTAYSVSEFRS